MSNYTKATNFAAKDSLPSGNAGKIIKGTEIDTEFNAIAAAISSKADSNSPTLTGTPLSPTATAGTNTTQIATTAFVQTAVAAAIAALMPAGTIILWSGSVASIPSGWVLCNGSNGTPDLRNRFVVGAGSTYAVNATGGATTATLAEANIPGHTHSFSASATTGNQSADHTHTFSGTTSGQSNTHNHTATDSGHTHTVSGGGTIDNVIAQRYSDNTGNINSTGAQTTSSGTANISVGNASADHTHTYSGTTSGMSANHTHSVTVSGTTGSTGSASAFGILPPYYALCYIMKT